MKELKVITSSPRELSFKPKTLETLALEEIKRMQKELKPSIFRKTKSKSR